MCSSAHTSPSVQAQQPSRPIRPSGPPVRVHGGASTPEIEARARDWARAGLAGDWARSTGSDPAAVARAMKYVVIE